MATSASDSEPDDGAADWVSATEGVEERAAPTLGQCAVGADGICWTMPCRALGSDSNESRVASRHVRVGRGEKW